MDSQSEILTAETQSTQSFGYLFLCDLFVWYVFFFLSSPLPPGGVGGGVTKRIIQIARCHISNFGRYRKRSGKINLLTAEQEHSRLEAKTSSQRFSLPAGNVNSKGNLRSERLFYQTEPFPSAGRPAVRDPKQRRVVDEDFHWCRC